MEKEFIPYKLALRLKQLGFDEPCFGFWLSNKTMHIGSESSVAMLSAFGNVTYFKAPLYQQAFSWFRDNYGLYASIVPKKSYPDGYVSGIEWVVNICGGNGEEIGPDDIFTYKEAEIVGLKKLIEIVKLK